MFESLPAVESNSKRADLSPGTPSMRSGGLATDFRRNSGIMDPDVSFEANVDLAKLPLAEQVVSMTDAAMFLRKAKRTLCNGMFVTCLRVHKRRPFGNSGGPLVKACNRQLYIGYTPEHLELTTSRSLETILHFSAIVEVINSQDGPAFQMMHAEKVYPVGRCLVIKCHSDAASELVSTEEDAEDTMCLVFANESDRRTAQFLLNCERRAIYERYNNIEIVFKKLLEDNGLADVIWTNTASVSVPSGHVEK